MDVYITTIAPKEKTFPGAFVDWDNTARRKNANSSIFVGSTPESSPYI
nr:glycoside hydrolase family 99-like domain-containing protein [Bacillus thuringiensis]